MSQPTQNYIRNGIFKPEEVLPYAIQETRSTKGFSKLYLGDDKKYYPIKMGSHRYWCFRETGLNCVECGIEGKFFAMETHKYGSGNVYYHMNLYALDKKGREVLMTKDHIIPKSKGGKNHITNYQTMCSPCNNRKGNGDPINVKIGMYYQSLDKNWAWKFIKHNGVIIGFNKIKDKWFAKHKDLPFIGLGNNFIEATRNLYMKMDGII